jgi:hypothetical protein
MAKEYFSHDYNARNDPKCVALIKDFGAAGYGIFWFLVEVMNEHGGKIKKFPALYSALSHEFRIKESILTKQIEAMLHKYELLLEDENYLWSESVLSRLIIRQEKSTKRAVAGHEGGIKSGESRRKKIESKQNEAPLEANEANEANKRKLKEIKEKEIIQLAFASEVFMKSWNEWEVFRKEKKQPVTHSTALKQNSFLKKFPESMAIEIINQSIEKGWTGLFEIKNSYNGTNSKQSKNGSKSAGFDELFDSVTDKLSSGGKANH